MKALIVHSSDIHFRENDNHFNEKVERFVEAFQNYCFKFDTLIMVITGDVAFSGKIEEYLQAMEFIDKVKTKIETYCGKELNIVMIPGNHDCNYKSKESSIREAIIPTIISDQISLDENIIEQCCKIQNEWKEFYDTYCLKNIIYSHLLLNISEYKCGKYKIIFFGYNTSWVSTLKEQYGHIYFPVDYFQKELFQVKGDLTISLLHHPFTWQSKEQHNFKTHIEETSDIVLTGHEHVASKSNSDDFRGNSTEYISGSILQDSNSENSGFNLIMFDLEQKKHKIQSYYWREGHYSCRNEDNNWVSYREGNNSGKDLFGLSKDFEQWLSDPGASFTHPKKSKIFLDDIFVWPNIENIRADREEDQKKYEVICDGDVLCKIDKEKSKVILVGEESSGKTTLCKILCKYYYDKGYIPIYLDGNDISSSSYEDFEKVLNKKVALQYSDKLVERFSQLSNNKKLLVIDNIDNSKLGVKYRGRLIKNISEIYSNIIFTGDALLELEGILHSQSNEPSVFEDYTLYKIMEFGHLARSEIIKKWYVVGQEEHIKDLDLLRIHDESKEIVDRIIGDNFIPSYPIYLLTILQTKEMGQPHNLRESTYGHYYSYLITHSLAKLKLSHDTVDAYYNYVSELAYYMFDMGDKELSETEFKKFDEWFSNEYKMETDKNELWKNLETAFIIEKKNDIYRIKYKYIYYFFVARYLANNITRPNVIATIKQLCKESYIEENANIILFLTHHSKDPLILTELIENAKTIFEKSKPIEFNQDVEFINRLMESLPKEVYDGRNVFKHREEQLRQQDKLENENKPKEDTFEYDSEAKKEIREAQKEVAVGSEFSNPDDEEMEFISSLNFAFKTIEIFGQVIKNYYGSMRGEQKRQFAENVYLLALRTLNSLFEKLSSNIDYFINEIGMIIEEKSLTDKEKIDNVTRQFLFRFAEAISYHIFKKTSSCIGTEKLSQVFEEIKGDIESNAVKLLDISIKLDYYKAFPFKDLEQLVKLEFGVLPKSLLRKFVLNYLYMFPTSYKDKQKICNIVGISIKTQHKIDQISTRKKK